MRESKLIALLRAVRPDELRRLAKFVRSPYHNGNAGVIDLFDYLRKYHPDFDSPRLEKETVFKRLLPGQPFDDSRLRLLMFRLSETVEEFLVAQRLQRERLQYGELLVLELGDRNQYELFERKNQALIAELEQTPYRDEPYYLLRWRLQNDYFFQPQTDRLAMPADRLKAILQDLDAFFILSKMRYGAELQNRRNILSQEYEMDLLEECRDLAARHPVFSEDKVFQVSRDVLLLMEEPRNETVYRRLEESMIDHLPLFRPADQSALLRYLINATIQLYGEGKADYLHNQFRLYRLGLEKDLFLSEDQLADTTFLNIIVTATVLKEIDWVEVFIQKYASKLPVESSEDAVRLGWAYWHFAAGRFELSNEMLRQIENFDLQYQLRAKSLSLRNHFEIFLQDDTYYDFWIYESKAYEKFLRRDRRLAGARVQAYLNLIYFLRKMAKWRLRPPKSTGKLAKLKAELENTPAVVARQWLSEKLTALIS